MGEGNSGRYTSGKLAKMFNVSPGSIKNWSEDGTLPPPERTPGGHRRFTDVHVVALNKLFNRDKPSPAPEATASGG